MNKYENEYRKFIVERLSALRVKAKLSARELSNRMGYSNGYIAKFEMGSVNIPSETLLDALNVLGVSPEKFFSKDPENYDKNKYIVDGLNSLSDENRQLVMDIITALKK